MSRSKIFPVKTSDDHWKKTAQILLQRNNLIIFDVSYASESLEWEIMQTRELGYEKNVIALASLSNKEEAIQWKLKYDFPDEHDIPIFFYDAQGNLEDDAGFSDTVVNKLSLTYEEGVRGLDMSRRYGLGQAFLTAGLALLFFLISLFFMGPYLLPQFVAMHTPFASQAVKAYIQTKIQDDNMGSSISQRNILNRIRRKWPHKSAGIIYDHALDHHKTECVAIQAILTELTDPEHIADYALLVLNGEPKISEAAFQIIESLNPNGNYGIAVKLLLGKRIYVKDKGSRLLQKTNLNSVLARQLLASLDHAPLETEPEPYQHFATGLFVSHKSYSEKLNAKLEETEFQTNFRLYRTLAPFIDSTSLPILHKLLDPNKPAGLRFLAALLKAGLNDAQGIGLLSNASFIEEDQNLMEQVFSVDPRYPYRPVIDSLIRSFSRQSVLPPISTILSDINAVRPGNNNAGFPASAKLLDIVIRFYSDEEFQQFLKGMINSESEELIEVFNDAWLKKEIPAERLIKLTEIARPRILPAISVGVPMSLRLKAAWILAHLGDTAVAATAIEAGQIRNFLNFLTYRDEAESILNTLLIHLKNTADPTPLRSLKPLKDSQQEVLIDRILRKLVSSKP
ncbi:MAG: hypothetical protein IPI66_13485 [Chitinophagaceae bacterium]|nr:hypothetical protein [Chitinophagaceae bacterium]